jgi:hypothetical protein
MAGNTIKDWHGISFHTDVWKVILTRNFKATAGNEEMGGGSSSTIYSSTFT